MTRFVGKLLCRLQLHAPMPGERWNAGYGFTRCARCQKDMVRSVLGRWHVPTKHRVVWRVGPVTATITTPAPETVVESTPIPPVETPPQPAPATATIAAPMPEAAVDSTPVPPPSPPPPPARRASPPLQSKAGQSRSPFDFGDFDDAPAPPRRLPPPRLFQAN